MRPLDLGPRGHVQHGYGRREIALPDAQVLVIGEPVAARRDPALGMELAPQWQHHVHQRIKSFDFLARQFMLKVKLQPVKGSRNGAFGPQLHIRGL